MVGARSCRRLRGSSWAGWVVGCAGPGDVAAVGCLVTVAGGQSPVLQHAKRTQVSRHSLLPIAVVDRVGLRVGHHQHPTGGVEGEGAWTGSAGPDPLDL